MIESYSFGMIVIDGRAYTSDVLITSRGVRSGWRREQGHLLQWKDLDDVLAEKPEVLVVGSGWSGMMKVHEEVLRLAKERGIRLVVQPTASAVETFNGMAGQKNVAAALHLTC